MLRDMKMKSVVITGASDGIGLEMAKAFAAQGFKVGLLARSADKLALGAELCRKLGAPQAEVAAVDVANFDQLRSALLEMDRKLGGTEIFIANAGIGGTFQIDADNWSDLLKTGQVNYLGAVAGLEAMKMKMIERGSGTLVAVSSMAATKGMPLMSGYCATKAALSTYLQSIRIELKKKGVTTVSVEPGYIDTALTKKNKGAMPFMIPAEQAGREIAAGILAKKRLVIVPKPYRAVKVVLKLLPDWLFEKLAGKFMLNVGRADRTA